MVHHSKDKSLIAKILNRADVLFRDFKPATMNVEEMKFFNNIQMAHVSLASKVNPNEARRQELEKRDEIEASQNDDQEYDDEVASELSLELRRSMKTVEVLGRILNNRAGSIKTAELNEIFEKGMNVHLRLITSFFELVKKMIAEPDYDLFLVDKLLEEDDRLGEDEAKKKAQKIFWKINFGFIVGMVKKISTSLGSKNTIRISDAVCSNNITPIKFIIQQDIAMRFAKNIRLDEIKNADKLNMPIVAKNALMFSIVQFCRYNRITDGDRSQLLQLGIKKHLLLPHPEA